jgi:hypothetical protein
MPQAPKGRADWQRPTWRGGSLNPLWAVGVSRSARNRHAHLAGAQPGGVTATSAMPRPPGRPVPNATAALAKRWKLPGRWAFRANTAATASTATAIPASAVALAQTGEHHGHPAGARPIVGLPTAGLPAVARRPGG